MVGSGAFPDRAGGMPVADPSQEALRTTMQVRPGVAMCSHTGGLDRGTAPSVGWLPGWSLLQLCCGHPSVGQEGPESSLRLVANLGWRREVERTKNS